MKFKENDRVRIINIREIDTIYDIDPDYLIGQIGTNPYLSENDIDCPYELVFDDTKAQEAGNIFWEENELELVESEEENKLLQEDKQKLFERFLNASFELKEELMKKLFQDETWLTDKEQEFTLALSEWHKSI